MYGVDFRGDADDNWILCCRDIPGLIGGESTYHCKGNASSSITSHGTKFGVLLWHSLCAGRYSRVVL